MKNYWSRRELEALGEPINPVSPTRFNSIVGGGGKGAPAPPDYKGAAEATAKSSAESIKAQTIANRPNINTPYGTQSWTNEKAFDQGRFDNATQNYQNSYVAPTKAYQEQGYQDGSENGQYVEGRYTPAQEGYYKMDAPDRNDFYGDDNWTQTTTLTPQSQKALDSQMAMQQGRSDIANNLMPSAEAAITTPIDYDSMQAMGAAPTASNFSFMDPNAANLQTSLDTSNVPAMPGESNSAYVQNYVDQANRYMDPSNRQAQGALDTQLSNKGVMQGSDAYNTAQRNLHDQQSRNRFNAVSVGNQQANTMYANNLAANNQGFNQSLASGQFGNSALAQQQSMQQGINTFNNQTRQNEFGQQTTAANYANTLRQQQIAESTQRQLQPLNNMNALMSGQQVGMPSMPSFNASAAAQPVNYSGAMQNQYQAELAQSNAKNAGFGNLTSGLMGLAGNGLMAYGMGGMG